MTDRLTGLDLHKSAVHLQLLIFAYLCTANDKKTSHITLRLTPPAPVVNRSHNHSTDWFMPPSAFTGRQPPHRHRQHNRKPPRQCAHHAARNRHHPPQPPRKPRPLRPAPHPGRRQELHRLQLRHPHITGNLLLFHPSRPIPPPGACAPTSTTPASSPTQKTTQMHLRISYRRATLPNPSTTIIGSDA